ncbi:MAG: ABC transporter substrate-binding protein, partial [Candidatus Latescibacterota bacterium]|nr:ABC transporter substrate-binding protein [Candidatus Latescibacterota bacterium]
MSTVRAELAPTGTLRAAINLSNFLLVSDRNFSGDPIGVSPDMARAVADRLGVPVEYVLYETPGALADTALDDLWDIGNLGAEPERAKTIDFTAAYAEIEATYLVPTGSPIRAVDEVDRDGIRISVSGRSAYGLWLADHIEHARLVKADSVEASFETFAQNGLEALAGLRPRLIKDVERLQGARILDGQFTAVQQAIGTKRDRPLAAVFLREFVEEAKANGLVQELIDRHGVN